VSKHEPDLSPLLPDDATLKARRAALVDAVGSGGRGPQPGRGRGRAPRLALGAALAVAAIAVALIVSAGGDHTQAAFAVEPQEGGGVTIKVYSLEDAAGLEQALEEAGIRAQVTWLPPGKFCREPHFTPSRAKVPGRGSLSGFVASGPGTLTISVGSTRASRSGGPLANFNLDPAAFRPDQSVVLSGSPMPYDGDPEGGFEARFQVAEGPVEPCRPASAPAGSIGSIAIPSGAAAGASDTPPPAPPGPGQFLYTRTKVVQLQGWEPDGPGAGERAKPRHFTANLLGPEGDALPARVPTVKEVWTARDGKTQVRETLGPIAFLSQADQERWEAAGSPPPFAYDPDEHAVQRDSAGRLVKEYASRSWRGRNEFAALDKLSRLPTEPEALRLAIENRGGGSPVAPSSVRSHRGAVTAERLMEILGEPVVSSSLRRAAVEALAELPGIRLERGVTDAAGRRGDAIEWERERGFGSRFIFDPRTFEVLSQAEMIFDAGAAKYPGVPDGTAYRETAYLETEIVDSDRERQGQDPE
jgi:hypothetical protein